MIPPGKDSAAATARNVPKSKDRSIAMDLAISLTALILAVSVALIAVSYWIANRNAGAGLEQKSKEYLTYLADALENPVWQLDEDGVKKISESFFNNEFIARLKVTEPSGSVLFQKEKKDSRAQGEFSGVISHDGQIIGHIHMALSSDEYEKVLYQSFWLNVVIIMANIIVVLLMTGVLLGRFMRKRLKGLILAIDGIAGGEYDSPLPGSRQKEIQAILFKFHYMTMQVKGREQALKQANTVLADQMHMLEESREALRESEEKYRLLMENARDAIFIVQDGVIKFPNPSAVELFGFTAEDTTPTPIASVIHPDDRDLVLKRYWTQSREEASPSSYVCRLVNKNGQELKVQYSIARITWQGEAASLICLRDITLQARMEMQVRQSQKLEALGILAGGVAHEFNNVLSIIVGNAEIGLNIIPESNPARKIFEEIRKASVRAADVVRQILSFTRKTVIEQKPVQLGSIVREALKFMGASLPSSIEIRQDISDEEDVIMADATQIHQVVINLANNAAHAMKGQGGVLDVSLRPVEIRPGDGIGGMSPGRYAKLTVRDTGRGIDPGIMDRIFDPFFTTKELLEGAGMGLSVVQGIMGMHKGFIQVESRLGEGTVFYLYFPVTARSVSPEIPVSQPAPLGNERILLIDDEESIILMEKQLFEYVGYRVHALSNPLEALDFFRNDPGSMDLVITDMTMPGMTGDQLAAEMIKIRPDIPIILCTGYSDLISDEKAEKLGIQGYIMKPFKLSEINRLIRKLMDKK